MDKNRTQLIEEATSCGACGLLTWTATHQPVMVDGKPHHPGCSFVRLRQRTVSVIGHLSDKERAVLGERFGVKMPSKPTDGLTGEVVKGLTDAVLGKMTGKSPLAGLVELAFKKAKKE